MSLEIKILLNGQASAHTINQLSLVDTSKTALQNWVSHLPMLNVGSTAKQIFTTVQEVALVELPDATRFELIEALRPATHSIIESLSKHYISPNIMLDERAQRIAGIAQQLHIQTAMIYHGIAIRTAQHYQKQTFGLFDLVKKKAMLNLIAKATHRGLAEFFSALSTLKILHLSDYSGLWLRIHELFNLVHGLALRTFAIEDSEQRYGKKATIEQLYFRIIFLSTCHTQKLRQAEIKKICQLSELWLDLATISPTPGQHDLLWIDTTMDAAPAYMNQAREPHAGVFYINVDPLLSHVERLYGDGSNLRHADEGALLSASLRLHLIQSLHTPLERASERQAYDGTLTLALGFIGAHYQLAGERDFAELIQISTMASNIDLADIYMDLNQNYELTHDATRENAMDDYVIAYQSDIVNVSETGYCIRWAGTPPNTLRTGELISLKQPDDANWSLGLVRWVQRHLSADPEFGVELLSEHGVACGARVILPDGNSSEYMRTLLLPHDQSECHSTLITPAMVFKTGHAVMIRLGDEEVQVQLGRELMVTQSFSQFEFTLISTNRSTQQVLNKLMS